MMMKYVLNTVVFFGGPGAFGQLKVFVYIGRLASVWRGAGILMIVLLLMTGSVRAQVEGRDFENLVKLAELYSQYVNGGEIFNKRIDSLRTPRLDRMIDVMISVSDASDKLLEPVVLNRPENAELKMWYAVREVHYNNQSENKQRRLSRDVVRETLGQDIDERWLVDNYYYRVTSGVAKLFNTADLSALDIHLDAYGLNDETEKAILYFNLVSSFTTRFIVLQRMKNPTALLKFAARLPSFNGKPYYEYAAFDFDDFDWIGYDKLESYKQRHIGSLYNAIFSHFSAVERDVAVMIYSKSILSKPAYFKYSTIEKDLNDFYKKMKKQLRDR